MQWSPAKRQKKAMAAVATTAQMPPIFMYTEDKDEKKCTLRTISVRCFCNVFAAEIVADNCWNVLNHMISMISRRGRKRLP